ncbi:hypothetical protein [Actinophytocola sp.]|uniref:hypothetical protein n=1 Tax=Actinophytocola sp. TaxID=1872138 RepID=UPI002D7F5F28|nr:hypothetical protein [Actinophytocola sp.]HET9144175.1 hypothetical protein [Actinophytocola sp.]
MTEQAPAGLEYKTLALAEVPLRIEVKSVALTEPAGPGTNGAVNAPYEYVDENGVHIGVAESFVAVTGVRDKVGDVIPPGSFARTLGELEPKACLGHDWNRPIGYPELIEEWLPGDRRLPEKKVDGTPWPEHAGVLFARTRYNLETEDGRRAYADAKFFGPQRTAWSIGYVPHATKTRHGIDPYTKLPTRFLHDPDLYEYSQVLHGAHPMALSQSIKSGEPDGIENKARFVQDSNYWGYPKGTPIRPGMRPRGKTAQRIRAQGKTPSPNEGVTTEAPKPDKPAPRMKPGAGKVENRVAGGDSEGLFPEPESEGRVRAENPKGADEQHVADLAQNEAGDLEGDQDDNRDKAFRGLLKEGITPNELRSDLENVADNEKNTSGYTLEPDQIDDLVGEYSARYDALAKRQARQRRGEPEQDGSAQDGAGQPAPQDETDGGAPGETPEGGPEGQQPAGGAGEPAGGDTAHAPEGDTGDGEPAPAAPKLSADKLATMNKRQAAAAVAELDDDNLAELDDEMTRRAAALGKAGQRSDAHQAVVDERAKRAAAGGQGEPGEPGGETDTGAPAGETPQVEDFQRQHFERLARNARPLSTRAQQLLADAKPDAEGHLAVQGVQGDRRIRELQNAGLAFGNADENGSVKLTPLGAQRRRELAGTDGAGPEQGTPEGTSGGTPEGTDQGVDTGDAGQPAGDEPSTQDGTEDTGGDIPAGEDMPPEDIAPAGDGLPEPGQVPPRTPLNERGDSYDEQGNLIEGNGRFGDAENAALDALHDHDETALTEALDQLRAGSFVDLTMADGTHVRRSESTAPLAAELVNSDPAEARRRILEWAATANGRHQADTRNQHLAQVAAYDALDDAELDAEEARLLQQRADFAADDASPYDTVLWENGIMLRALEESRRKRGEQTLPGAEDAEPEQPDGAVITADEIADAEELADASHGVREADDGAVEVDDDVAARQDRVAGLLTQASTAAGLDLSTRDDNQLRADRADVVAELRLQTYLEARRRKQNGDTTGEDPVSPDDAGTTTGRRASGEITDSEDEGKPPAPPGPPTRPGVAGAAEDFADALELPEGPERAEAVERTRARLASSLRRSRSDTDAVKALRALMDGPADPTPQELRDAAEAIRADARARRNENARNRRTARRFERERLRSLLGQIEAEMSNRGIEYDTAPEDLATPDNDGALPGGAVNPTAGTWVHRVERIEWAGQQNDVAEVTGSHYSASVTTPQGRRATYEWAVTDDQGNTVASGSGETPDTASAQAAIEIALATQAKLGNLPADAHLPTANLPTDSSRRPAEEITAAMDAVRERLTRPGRPVNPITGRPDPLTSAGVTTRPATRRAFDSSADVRAHLTHRIATMDDRDRAGFLNKTLDDIRWDDVTLTPGGQFMVVTRASDRSPALFSTTHGLYVSPADGMSVVRMGKADLLKYGSLLETIRDDNGRGIDWTVEAGPEMNAQLNELDFGNGVTGLSGLTQVATRTIAMDKLRAGKWQDKLVRQVTAASIGNDGVNNWTRRDYTKSTHRVLDLTLANGFGRKQDAEDRKTLAIADGAELLANMGAPDAAAVLLRRRATELRDQYGTTADDKGANLLEAMAIGILGTYSPVRSSGDRAVNLRMGERLTFADPETGGVRTFRALSPMRSEGGSYGGSTALVVDESSGKLYDAKIGNAVGGGQRISLYNRSVAEGRGYADFTNDLGSSGFAVTGPGEPVPTTRDELREAATADASIFGQDVLDAAADTLPESAAERANRRGAAPDGERPPRRTSPRAPRRQAPKPEDVKPVPGEAYLADVQGQHRQNYMGGDFSLADEAGPNGFASLDEARQWAREQSATMPDLDKRGTPGYMLVRVADDPAFTEAGGARLSPGGHFIITKDALVIHARTGGAVWGFGPTMEGTTFSTRDSATAVADYLERGRFDGQGIDWSAPRDRLVTQTRAVLGSRTTGEKLQPGALVARAAITDMLANTKTAPKGDDLDSMRNVLDALDRLGVGIRNAPNPDAFTVYENRLKTNRYVALSGQRVQGEDMVAANSKAGERIAKKVRDEFRIAEALGQAAPLDAVRRLNRVADSIGDEKITDANGKDYTPAADLRALAKQITDTWDSDNPSPLGRLLRNDSRGTIRPRRPIEIEPTGAVNSTEDALQRAEREAERLTRTLARYPLRLDRDDNGDLRARFGLNEIISDGYGEKISINADGSIEIVWPQDRVGRMRLYLPPGSWDYDPNTDDALPDASGVGTPDSGDGGDPAREALTKLADFREKTAKKVADLLGATLKPGGSTSIDDANYDPGYVMAQNVINYVQLGEFDKATQGVRVLNRFYRANLRSDFDGEDVVNQIDSLSVADEVLADAAPFAPAVGGTPEKRAAVNDLMFTITADGDPSVVRDLKRILLYDGGIEGAKPETLANYSLDTQVMKVAGTALDNPDDMTDEGKGWFSQSGLGLLDRTLTHEYGHHLHNMLIKTDSTRNQRMMEEIAESMGIGLRGDERGFGAQDWVPSRQSTIIARVGTYAATNHFELVAELFTEWRGKKDGASEPAQIVGKYLGNPNAGAPELNAQRPPAAPNLPETGDQQRADREARTQDFFGGNNDTEQTATQTAEGVNEDDNQAANA